MKKLLILLVFLIASLTSFEQSKKPQLQQLLKNTNYVLIYEKEVDTKINYTTSCKITEFNFLDNKGSTISYDCTDNQTNLNIEEFTWFVESGKLVLLMTNKKLKFSVTFLNTHLLLLSTENRTICLGKK